MSRVPNPSAGEALGPLPGPQGRGQDSAPGTASPGDRAGSRRRPGQGPPATVVRTTASPPLSFLTRKIGVETAPQNYTVPWWPLATCGCLSTGRTAVPVAVL